MAAVDDAQQAKPTSAGSDVPHATAEGAAEPKADLEKWMGQMPESMKSRCITQLALPGTHNSGTKEVLTVPNEVLTKYVGRCMGTSACVSSVVTPFTTFPAICQDKTIAEQLHAGIRILDFRVGLHKDEIHICHTVVCKLKFEDALREVADFLAAQPSEVVVVMIKRDFEHKSFDTAENWTRVQDCISSTFGSLVASSEMVLRESYTDVLSSGRRAIVMTQIPKGLPHVTGLLMTPAILESSWKGTTKALGALLKILEEWRSSGRMSPVSGKLRILDVELPGWPSNTAEKVNAAFRKFMCSTTVSIGTIMDFPDEKTVRMVIANNWSQVTCQSGAQDAAGSNDADQAVEVHI